MPCQVRILSDLWGRWLHEEIPGRDQPPCKAEVVGSGPLNMVMTMQHKQVARQ